MSLDPRFAWLTLPHHQEILHILAQEKGEGRFVGSAVRNSLFGLPIKDFDIATTHTPDQVESLFKRANLSVIPTGRAFGTLTVVLKPDVYEITTLRQDLKTDGRHAEVSFTTEWALDAARRDFTMNALYLDASGKIYDFYKGRADLEAGRVCFIGDPATRIREDYLRILRFFRFNAFYSKGPINAEGLEACCAFKENMLRLSRERITSEFLRLLEALNPWPLLELIAEKEMLPFISGVPDTTSPLHFQAQLRSMALLESMGPVASPLVRLKSLFRQEGAVPPRFRLTRAEQKIWDHLNREGDIFLEFSEKIATQHLPLEEARVLFRQALCKQQQENETPFPITGEDLLHLGFVPGKEVGQALQELRQWWKAQDPLPDREACLEYLTSRYSKR